MWGTKRHGLVSAGMTFEPPSGTSEEPTEACVMLWYQCQCGLTFATQLMCEFASDEEMENLVSGLMCAAQAVLSRTGNPVPSPPSSTDLSSNLTRVAQRLSESGASEAKNA